MICLHVLLLKQDLTGLAILNPKELTKCPAHSWCSVKTGGTNEMALIQ